MVENLDTILLYVLLHVCMYVCMYSAHIYFRVTFESTICADVDGSSSVLRHECAANVSQDLARSVEVPQSRRVCLNVCMYVCMYIVYVLWIA